MRTSAYLYPKKTIFSLFFHSFGVKELYEDNCSMANIKRIFVLKRHLRYSFFLFSTRYATVISPAMAHTTSKPGSSGVGVAGTGVGVVAGVGIGVSVGVAIIVGVGVASGVDATAGLPG
jgi:hypothetical protein